MCIRDRPKTKAAASTLLDTEVAEEPEAPTQEEVTELEATIIADTPMDEATIAGGLDALVNNAGVMDESDMERTLEVNLDGVAAVTAAIAPLLGAGGRVINVSSGAGLRAAGGLAPGGREARRAATVADIRAAAARLAVGSETVYGLSKAALTAYTKLAARTYPALRVNACSPGFCRTEIAGPNADYSEREPKAPALGADVITKLLFDDALSPATGKFFKECSKPGTAHENAVSREQPW